LDGTARGGVVSPDGARLAIVGGAHVELVSLKPDEEELAYRRLHTRPNLRRYREGYGAALAANDDFALGFYIHLLPPAERPALEAWAAADRKLAAVYTNGARRHLVSESAAKPLDVGLFTDVAALQAWFGQGEELAATRRRILAAARDADDPNLTYWAAWACSIVASPDKAEREAVLALARKAADLDKGQPVKQVVLGIAEYRSGDDDAAEEALLAAEKAEMGDPNLAAQSRFYRAMILFRRGKPDEARKLAAEAAVKMKPLPRDEKNPLVGDAGAYDLILWLAYKEAKALIGFDAPPAPPPEKKQPW
jgi:hypothetical protein